MQIKLLYVVLWTDERTLVARRAAKTERYRLEIFENT